MAFDLTSPRLVLAGTLDGETRGCGRAAMEDVAQVILNRVATRWDAGGVVGVCLARLQFSCWNAGDPNRSQILAAPGNKAAASLWQLCLAVADAALAGHNPDRVGGADCYYARSMPAPPYWARPPARKTYQDGYHAFWLTRAAPHAPTTSARASGLSPAIDTAAAPDAAELLNQAQLDRIR